MPRIDSKYLNPIRADLRADLTDVAGLFKVFLLLIGVSLLASCGGGGSGSSNGADPGVLEAPIAYVKRPIPLDEDGDLIRTEIREPLLFIEGGDLYIRSNSTATATETNITRSVTDGMGDVKGINASFDGEKIVFSLRLFDPNPNDDDTPTWNIYEYDLTTEVLRRVIPSDLRAEEGDDLFPAYLPDGRIVFTSSRQRQSQEMLSNEGRPRFSGLDEDGNTIALVLHVMNDDGSDIHQISFNQSHDLYPTVLSNNFSGQIMFSRWDNTGANREFNLYKSNPDGSDLQILYGSHSHDDGVQYLKPREMSDGRIMVLGQPFQDTFDGGDIVQIDAERFIDNDQPLWTLQGLLGPAETPATINDVIVDGNISLDGRYNAAYPLWDGSDRMLVSKSTCQIIVDEINRPCIEPWISDESAEETFPAYSIWIYDTRNDTEKVVVRAEQGIVITDPVAIQFRELPTVLLDQSAELINQVWSDEGLGAINIRSVYDLGDENFDGCFFGVCTDAASITSAQDLGNPAMATADQRPARFVRFVKAVALPDDDDPTLDNPPDLSGSAFGLQRNLGMREIVGYAPIEPDGSVMVKVPANVALGVEVVDRSGFRIGPRHQNWFSVAPGATLSCQGCHTHDNGGETPYPHQRSDATATSINSGVGASGVFENTLIPGTTDAYWGNLGQSMAEVRFERVAQTLPLATPEPELSADVNYIDVWTDSAVRTPDTSFSYLYANLDATMLKPDSTSCTPWDFKCRSVINYEQHIHPLWQIDRGTDVDLNGVGDDTCTQCHTIDLDGVAQVAAAQLDLTDGFSDQNAQRFKSFQELFINDQGEELDGTTVVNIQIEVPVLDENGVQVVDSDGNPVTEFIDDPAATVTSTMSANGARASYFIEKMTETEYNAGRALSTPATDPEYLDHSALLSPDELRLIGEWLDLGGQYFNDPFDPAAPQN